MRYSPTSINTWMLCPRKFYYKYIVKLPEYPNIHSVKGKAVHKVLENMFYGVKYIDPMKFVKEELNKIWNIETVEISKEDEAKAKQDAINILELFAFIHQKKIEGIIHNEKAKGLDHAWNLLRPKFREKRYKSEDLLGIVDKEEVDYKKRVSIIDYKTSHKYFNDFKEDDERQTRLYALMYYREHKKLPDFIKINYLRFGEVWPIRVTPDIIKLAEIDLETVKLHTQTIEEKDYPKKPTKLCDWCSFKKECFKKEKVVNEVKE